jgi:hypothetical protein
MYANWRSKFRRSPWEPIGARACSVIKVLTVRPAPRFCNESTKPQNPCNRGNDANWSRPARFLLASLIVSLTARGAGAQAATLGTEIPLQRCDRLPVAILQVDKADKRFLIDTAATSLLNEKSFTSGRTKEVHVQSWNQTTALNAREVSIGELALGSHSLRGIRLPAIDLTAIAKACGGPLDGILGVDLLEQLGVSIDLKRSVARLGVAAPSTGRRPLLQIWSKQCIPARKPSTTRTPTGWPLVSIRISS